MCETRMIGGALAGKHHGAGLGAVRICTTSVDALPTVIEARDREATTREALRLLVRADARERTRGLPLEVEAAA